MRRVVFPGIYGNLHDGGEKRSGAVTRAVMRFALLPLFICVIFASGAFPGTAAANVFYAVSNYTNGSAGVIAKDGGAFSVRRDAVANLGLDAWGFTFRDHNGDERAMIREYQYGPNDTVYVWNPADWTKPVINTGAWGSNIHAAASDGDYLYLATYESYKDGSRDQDAGEVVRVDMRNGYKADRRYRYEAFTGDAGFTSSPHGETIHIENGRIYVLFGVSYKGVNEYEPTEIVEFDAELNRLRTVRLKDENGNIGKNAMRMAAHGGKLYVANMGGYQGPDAWGDLWEADIESMTARKLLDGRDIPYTVDGMQVNVGMYGIQFSADGVVFLLTGSYSGDYNFRARLFITTAERLSKGDVGSAVADAVAEYTKERGYSWDILWDENDSTLWCMTGKTLEARDKSGNLLRSFTPAELGDDIYSVSLQSGSGSQQTPDGDEGNNAGDGNGGGGGGCAGGASGIALFLALLYMALKGKKAPIAMIAVMLITITGFAAAGAAEAAQVKFLVTPGAGIRAFSKDSGEYLQTAHFVLFKEYSLSKGADEGGYETYSFTADGERFHYIAGGGNTGFLKTAKIVYLRADGQSETITVDVERLNPDKREDNGFKGDGVYLNVNDAQHLVLNAGETFRLIPTRVWQAAEGFTENYFIEPDYKIEVLGDSGAVSQKWAGSPGLEYAEITGLKPGVAVIKVTYGPIRFEYDGGKSEYYSAIDPIETGVAVVSVVQGDKGNSGITSNITRREYDTVYFDKANGDHALYNIEPSGAAGISVRVHRPVHGETAWGSGWSDGIKNADGSFTVNLYEGRNIVEMSAAGAAFSEYHVINAKGIDISVANVTRPGNALSPGDKAEISFTGIKTPLEKIAGIYNPGFPDTCYVRYETADGEEIRGEGVQYNLSEENRITVTVPASGNAELKNGVIVCDHLGDPLGSHRTRIGHEPVYPNFRAVNVKGVYSSMPDIALSRQSEDSGGTSPGGSGGGGCAAGAPAFAGIIALAAASAKALAAKKNRRGFLR